MKKLVIVDDYHELDFIARAMVSKAKHLELGTIVTRNCRYKQYLGVVYEGRRPTSGEISDLLYRAKIKKTDNDDEYVQQ
jgi:hypothetical protein